MLITCPECSREISDAAAACPGCGLSLSTHRLTKLRTYHAPATQKRPAAGALLLGAGVLLLGIIAIGLASGAPSPRGPGATRAGSPALTPSAPDHSGAAVDETPERKANFAAIPTDMARIYDSLRDTSGVRWGTVTGTRNGTAICGSVNAHNAFGGYTGLRHFIFDEAVGDPGVPAMGAYVHWEERAGFSREWKKLCLGDPNAVTVEGESVAGTVVALAPSARDAGL